MEKEACKSKISSNVLLGEEESVYTQYVAFAHEHIFTSLSICG